MWTFLAFLSAFSSSAKFVIGKLSSTKTDEYISAFSMQFFASIILFPFVIATGVPEIKSLFWPSLLGLVITTSSWSILYAKALKLSPLSISVPMLAFNPIFTAIFSLFFDNKLPDVLGWLGISCIAIGIYLSRIDSRVKKGLFYPILGIRHEPGTLAMLAVGFIWSIGAHLSKMNTLASSPLFFAFSSTLAGSLVLFLIAYFKTKVVFSQAIKHYKYALSLGAIHGFGELTFGAALSLGYTPFVVAIVRSSILWSSLIGGVLFKETFTKIKIFGLVLLFLGVVILVL